jgi:hypothetical protein
MPKTVKVRIAVAVDPEGDWNATGWRGRDGEPVDEEAMEIVADNLNPGERRFWVEAELPVPERDAVTIQGAVSDA